MATRQTLQACRIGSMFSRPVISLSFLRMNFTSVQVFVSSYHIPANNTTNPVQNMHRALAVAKLQFRRQEERTVGRSKVVRKFLPVVETFSLQKFKNGDTCSPFLSICRTNAISCALTRDKHKIAPVYNLWNKNQVLWSETWNFFRLPIFWARMSISLQTSSMVTPHSFIITIMW